jgi:hypothetical protein
MTLVPETRRAAPSRGARVGNPDLPSEYPAAPAAYRRPDVVFLSMFASCRSGTRAAEVQSLELLHLDLTRRIGNDVPVQANEKFPSSMGVRSGDR